MGRPGVQVESGRHFLPVVRAKSASLKQNAPVARTTHVKRFLRTTAFAVLPALTSVSAALAAPNTVVEAVDPDVDDYGPGTYLYPLEPYFLRRGVFDLKRFRVRDGGDDWIFEVEVDRPIDRPIELRATRARYIRFEGEVFFQNFDIYIRTPKDKETRFDRSIPGRNFKFAPGHEWNRAVVITPYPSHVASLLTEWDAGGSTLVPNVVRRIGPRFFVRVPKEQIGDRNPKSWRYAVTVSGALPLIQDYRRADRDYTTALTMPVRPQPGREHFGGADLSPYNPAIIDLLAPTREDQKKMLAGGDGHRRTSLVEIKLTEIPLPRAAKRAAAR